MRSSIMALVIGLFAVAAVVQAAELLGHHHCCPHCGATPDCCYVEQVVHRCKLVPDNQPIKKTVYDLKEIPYCSKKPSCGHTGCCEECAECQACVKYRKVLVKKEVTVGEKCGTKCVVEECVELVAVPCCKCGCKEHCGR